MQSVGFIRAKNSGQIDPAILLLRARIAGKDWPRGNRMVPGPRDFGCLLVTVAAGSELVFVELVVVSIVTASAATFGAVPLYHIAIMKMAVVICEIVRHDNRPAFSIITEQAAVICGIVEPFAGNAERDTSRCRHQTRGHCECH